MTETSAAETPETIVEPGCIYNQHGRLMLAVERNELRLLGGANNEPHSPGADIELYGRTGSVTWNALMMDAHRNLTEDLASERSSAKNLFDRLRQKEHYIEKLGLALREEAENRDWCDEYDEFAEDWDLPQRHREYKVTVSFTVIAENEDDASDMVERETGSLVDGFASADLVDVVKV